MKMVFTKIIGILFGMMLFSSPAQSLELGQIILESNLNEPLRASVSIDNIDTNELADVRISVADHDSYQLIGLSKPSDLPKLKFEITASQDGRHIVKITSRRAIKSPILEVLIKVSDKQNNLLRHYTLLIDPVVTELKTAKVASETTITAELTTNKATDNIVLNNPVSNLIPVDEIEPSKDIDTDQNTILVKGSNISLISQNSPLHEKYSVYQIMRAFYLGNGDAFINKNISKLQTGSRLVVPDEKIVAEVTRQKAVNFVYSVSSDFPSAKKAPAKLSQTVASIPDIAPQRLDIKDIKQSVLQLNSDSQAAPEIQISPQVQGDLKTWRTMTDEFKSLSSVVQSQNQVLKVHSGAIQEMNATLVAKNDQDEQIELRMQMVELSRPNEVTYQDSDEVAGQSNLVQNALQNQNKVISLQGERINNFTDLLVKNNEEITGLNNRVGVIERELKVVSQQASSTQQALLTAPPEIVTVSRSASTRAKLVNYIYSPLLWLAIAAIVLLIFAVREINWRRRVGGPNSPNKNQMKPRHNGIAVDDKKDMDVNYVSQKTSTNASSNNSDNKVTGKGPIGITSIPGMKKSKLKNINDIYTELDIYIVYELFDEAQTLLNAAREVHRNDSGLDLKELEILGHTKNFELFLSMFEEKKDFLSSRFPVDWGKLEKMKDKLSTELQFSKTQKI